MKTPSNLSHPQNKKNLTLPYLYFQLCRKFLKKLKRWTIFGNKIFNVEEGGKLIKEYLSREEPCMIARIGSVEMQAINAVINTEQGLRHEIPQANLQVLCNNAGFFPATQEATRQFAEIYRDACADVDIAAMLMNRDEDYFYKKYTNNSKYITLTALEPYYSKSPWSTVLEGKRVLVINPLVESIASQYKKRNLLFSNDQILPEFTLLTLKAVQSIGDNTDGFDTWFDALDYMKNEIENLDFDIAILGCGAYAFPLASHVKRLGKKAVVMGGATQILFGVKGKRWDENPEISQLYNEHWVYPNINERPKGFEKVENGCYW